MKLEDFLPSGDPGARDAARCAARAALDPEDRAAEDEAADDDARWADREMLRGWQRALAALLLAQDGTLGAVRPDLLRQLGARVVAVMRHLGEFGRDTMRRSPEVMSAFVSDMATHPFFRDKQAATLDGMIAAAEAAARGE